MLSMTVFFLRKVSINTNIHFILNFFYKKLNLHIFIKKKDELHHYLY